MNKPLILLVEDNPDDVCLLKDALSCIDAGYPIAVLGAGEDAIDYLQGKGEYADRQRHPIPGLVMLDNGLPRMSGLEVLDWIRHEPGLKGLAVTMLSASTSPAGIQRAYDLGVDSYQIKPITLDGARNILGRIAMSLESPMRILLLDDNHDDASLVTDELRRAFPAATITATEGRAGILAAIEGLAYDLVITDYQMQTIDGLAVLQAVKARHPDCPVIMFTGTGDEAIAVKALRSGLDDYLPKSPQHYARLPVCVRSVMGRNWPRRALRESEALYRLTFEQVAIGMAHADLDGHYIRTNQKFCDIVGYTAEELRQRTFRDITHADDLDRDISYYHRLMEGDMSTYATEKRYVHKDGSPVWVHVTVSMLRTPSGDPERFILVIKDIRDRKETEKKLHQSEEQLRQAQKMEAIGRLAGGVAHDFNNLLTVILGYSSVLMSELGAGSPLARDLGEVRKAADRAAALTRQLLIFSRKQTLVPQLLDINTVISGLEKMLRRIIGEDIELSIGLCPEGCSAEADPGQIEQVIMNLAVNSRDAMPAGGRLKIATVRVESDEAFERAHPGIPPGSYSVISVRDTGTGIDPEVQSHIFEPFFTTKGEGEGTGLGLSTVYGIVKQSNGHIEVQSEVGHGTTFAIYLPHKLEKPLAAAASGQADAQPHGDGETILIVEDDETLRALVCQVLRARGYQVIEAMGPIRDADRIPTHGAKIDLLITDLVMPGMGGREIAAVLRDRHPELKVLYMSGYADQTITLRGLTDSSAAFLQKPFTPGALTEKVREVLSSCGRSDA